MEALVKEKHVIYVAISIDHVTVTCKIKHVEAMGFTTVLPTDLICVFPHLPGEGC